MSDTGFGRQRIQTHVPGVGESGIDPLAIEGESHQARTLPLMPRPSKGERAIIESAAHTQSPALAVDSHQGYDDEIEPTRPGPSTGAMWNGDAESTATRLPRQWMETQTPMAQIDDDRDEDADPTVPCGAHEGGGGGLTVEGQIDRHSGACLECGQSGHRRYGPIRALRMIRGRQRAALRAQLFT